ncbi:hypothetical protein J2W97_002557 [Paenibacillus jamilae]|jgi:hypothetical protein|nr:hypothetical protein [Paenibacillus jamilae]
MPDKERDYDHPMAAKVGEILGHVATTLQGAGEVVAGLGGEGLSVAVSSTGVGSIVGVPGLIGSAALAAHGSTTAFKGASGIGEKTAELWQMVKGEGGDSSKSTPSSGAKAESVPHTQGNGETAQIGDTFGKSGTLAENPGTQIDWSNSSNHALERMQERGVTKEMADSWMENGKTLSQNNGSKHLFFSKEGAAVVANDGTLVTVIPKSKYDDAYKALSKSLFGE